jgi:septum formation protein
MRLVLASGSPRRRELLERLGLEFDVVPADVDETRRPDEPPAEYVDRVARAKAEAVAGADRVVIAADTAVVFDGKVYGKPAHPEEARTMLRRLQNGTHEVFTALAVSTWAETPVMASIVDITEVEMLPMTDDEIADYVDSGEPMDKAGAYALQGWGGLYVKRLVGSPFTVVGLPIHLLDRLIGSAGVRMSRFRGAGGAG